MPWTPPRKYDRKLHLSFLKLKKEGKGTSSLWGKLFVLEQLRKKYVSDHPYSKELYERLKSGERKGLLTPEEKMLLKIFEQIKDGKRKLKPRPYLTYDEKVRLYNDYLEQYPNPRTRKEKISTEMKTLRDLINRTERDKKYRQKRPNASP